MKSETKTSIAAAAAVALAVTAASAPVASPRAQAQAQSDEFGNIFGGDEYGGGEFNPPAQPAPPPPGGATNPADPNGQFPQAGGAPGAPPGVFTPPPPAGGDFGAPNGAGFPADGGGKQNPFKTGGGSNHGGSKLGLGGGANPPGAKASAAAKKPTDPKKPSMATAEPEDITNENFPDLIDSFDYPNAEITDIVKAISQLTKRNFIIDSGVRGKISIVAPTQITVAEAYKAFLSALAANGFTVVQSGKFYKIKQARDAQRDSIETYTGAYYPNSDLMITRIIHLKHISADEVNKNLLRILPSKNGEFTPYPPTNSLIISDYGSNIERIVQILEQLDKPGFDEQLQVMPVRYAKAKDVAELVTKIINKDSGGSQNPGGFGAVRPFRPATGGKPEELSIVAPDERTNSLIVVGNGAGIDKVRGLVRKLDYKLDPTEAGGVQVYYVKYGEAEKIAQTINGLAQATGASTGASGAAGAGGAGGFGSPLGGFGSPNKSVNPADKQNLFNGDVKIQPDKNTNSLVIVASKQDYESVLNLLSKLDIPRDQVYIEAVIMELSTDKQRIWDLAIYKFAEDPSHPGQGQLAARTGFSGDGTLGKVLNPSGDKGAILGFGTGGPLQIQLPAALGGTTAGSTVTIPSLLAFVNFLQTTNESNVLATPQLLASDNEEAVVEVGEEAPVGQTSAVGTGTTPTTTSIQREKLTTKLTVTPLIRPDSDVVRMKIKMPIKQLSNKNVSAPNLAQNAVITTERNIETNIVVPNGDTAVLGGLMRDDESVVETKVPILGDIPVLGWLFKSSTVHRQKLNLLVFITPKIIRNVTDSQRNFVHKAKERIDWVKQNFGGRDPYGKFMDEMPRAQIPEDEKVEGPRKKQ